MLRFAQMDGIVAALHLFQENIHGRATHHNHLPSLWFQQTGPAQRDS
jgi:hypothetical protein